MLLSLDMRCARVYTLHALAPNLYRKCHGPIPTLLRPRIKISQRMKSLARHLLKIILRASVETSTAAPASRARVIPARK